MAREEAFRKLPNIEINRIDHDDQMQLAMRAGGGGAAEIAGEKALWRKAEIEVHGQAPSSPGSAAPSPAMATTSPVLFATDRNDENGAELATRFGARRLDPFAFTCGLSGRSNPPFPRAAPAAGASKPGQGRGRLRARDRRRGRARPAPTRS